MPILGKGQVLLKLSNGQSFELSPVLHVPDLTKNLFSTISLGQLRLYRIIIEDDSTRIIREDDESKVLISGQPYRGLILLDAISICNPSQKGVSETHINQKLTEL